MLPICTVVSTLCKLPCSALFRCNWGVSPTLCNPLPVQILPLMPIPQLSYISFCAICTLSCGATCPGKNLQLKGSVLYAVGQMKNRRRLSVSCVPGQDHGQAIESRHLWQHHLLPHPLQDRTGHRCPHGRCHDSRDVELRLGQPRHLRH